MLHAGLPAACLSVCTCSVTARPPMQHLQRRGIPRTDGDIGGVTSLSQPPCMMRILQSSGFVVQPNRGASPLKQHLLLWIRSAAVRRG